MVETVLTILLHGHALRLHLVNTGDPRPLVVYATGDGGWHRKDVDFFKHVAQLGLPAVGFDARDYVTHLGAPTVPAAELAADYARIIDCARGGLQMAGERPVVLLGVSRGAGLAVVAAGEGGLGAPLAGVVAVALTEEEEFVTGQPAPYAYLRRLTGVPVAVIQSTRDRYLTSDAARALLGADMPYRWLQPVQARNHSFGGGRPQLYLAVRRAVAWLLGVSSACCRTGQPHAKRGAEAFAGTFGRDGAAVELDEMADDGEAEAETAVAASGPRIRLTKTLEHVGQEIGRDAGTGVDDGDLDSGVHARHAQRDRARFGRELNRIGQQVPDDLLQPIRIGDDRRQLGLVARLEAEGLGAQRRAHRFNGGADDFFNADGTRLQTQLAGNRARHVEQIVNQPRLRIGVALDRRDGAELFRLRHLARPEHSRPPVDCGQRRAQLV